MLGGHQELILRTINSDADACELVTTGSILETI